MALHWLTNVLNTFSDPVLFVTAYNVTHRVTLTPAAVSMQSPGDLASDSQHACALEFCTHLPLYVHSVTFPTVQFRLIVFHRLDLITFIKAIKNWTVRREISSDMLLLVYLWDDW